jgi:hypothetical protein
MSDLGLKEILKEKLLKPARPLAALALLGGAGTLLFSDGDSNFDFLLDGVSKNIEKRFSKKVPPAAKKKRKKKSKIKKRKLESKNKIASNKFLENVFDAAVKTPNLDNIKAAKNPKAEALVEVAPEGRRTITEVADTQVAADTSDPQNQETPITPSAENVATETSDFIPVPVAGPNGGPDDPGPEEDPTPGPEFPSPQAPEFAAKSDFEAPTVSITNASQGAYAANPTVGIAMSEAGTIFYCLQQNGCCDPFLSGQEFTEEFTVGEVEGTFCLSIGGKDLSGNFSEKKELSYIINSSLPDLNVNFTLSKLQSGEVQNFLEATSSHMGESGFAFSVLNILDNSFSASCDDFVTDFDVVNFRAPSSEGDFVTNLIDIAPAASVNVPLSLDLNLNWGTNNIVSLLENQNPLDRSLFSCVTQTLVVEDFFLAQPLFVDKASSAPNVDGLTEFQGGFVQFGHFEPASDSGPGTAEGSNSVTLESGIFNIIN